MHNGGAVAYQLSPCPAYEEYIVSRDAFIHPNYYLDCDTVQQIPAGGSITYEMRLDLPAYIDSTGSHRKPSVSNVAGFPAPVGRRVSRGRSLA